MKIWSTWYDYTIPWLPGIDTPMVDHALRRAAMDLCDFARCMIYSVPTFQTVDGTRAYTLTMPDTSVEVVDVLYGSNDAGNMNPMTTRKLQSEGQWAAVAGAPPMFWYFVNGTTQVQLYGLPNGVYDIDLTVAIRPTESATGVYDDETATQYRQVIADGAIAMLAAMPKKPWTDPVLAGRHASAFDEGKTSARIDALKNWSGGDIYIQPRSFGQ